MPSLPLVGQEFAGYRLQAVIGRGGMSVVYQAEHPRLGSILALKVIAAELAMDDVFRARFLQESRTAASLRHPNVIPIYDTGPYDELLYIAMRYVAGADLRRVLKVRNRLSAAQTLMTIGQTGRALDAAHRHELVHRDVKPANILLERGSADEPDHVYLADFGITKHAMSRSGLTSTGQFVGTIDYIAPEQIKGKAVDGRADVYSLGCVLYECLTGRVPFEKDLDAAVIWAHVEEMPPLPTTILVDLPKAIDDVISVALAKDPDSRYQTCHDLVDAASKALEPARAHLAAEESRADDRASLPETVLGGPVARAAPALGGDAGAVSANMAPELAPPVPDSRALGQPREPDGRDRPPFGPPPPDRRGGMRRLLPAAAAVAVLAIAAGIILWAPWQDEPSSGPEQATPRAQGAVLDALARVNNSADAKGLVPSSTCTEDNPSVVTCIMPTAAVSEVTFTQFPTLDSLYRDYVKVVGEHDPDGFQENFGNCLPKKTHGELSWNHDFQHPRRFTLEQLRAGNLGGDEAAGRLFCILSDEQFHIIWTTNAGRLLGNLHGSPHADAWRWWRAVHHSLAISESDAAAGAEQQAAPDEEHQPHEEGADQK